MSDNNRVPHGAFFDGDEAGVAARELLRNLEEFRRRLGISALSAGDQGELLPVLELLSQNVDGTVEDVRSFEEKERFGGEESYWTVFRLICAEDNRNVHLTPAQIWEHLALNYDMSGETIGSVLDTIREWGPDIEEDASRKFKLVGKMQYVKDGSMVYVGEPIAPVQKVVPRKRSIVKPTKEKKTPPSEIELTTLQTLRALIENDDGYVRQATLVKMIRSAGTIFDEKTILDEINRLEQQKKLYKFKVIPRSPACVCLDENVALQYDTVARSEQHASIDMTEKQSPSINMSLACDIVQNIIDTLTHVEQMKPAQTIAKELGVDVNQTIRQLRTAGILRTDTGSMLGGRRKERSKAKSQKVMRAGLKNQSVKDEIKELASEKQLEDWILLKVQNTILS